MTNRASSLPIRYPFRFGSGIRGADVGESRRKAPMPRLILKNLSQLVTRARLVCRMPILGGVLLAVLAVAVVAGISFSGVSTAAAATTVGRYDVLELPFNYSSAGLANPQEQVT